MGRRHRRDKRRCWWGWSLPGPWSGFSADCGFVRAVTGLEAPNGTFLQVDPVRSDPGSEQISAFPRVELRWTPLLWLRNPC